MSMDSGTDDFANDKEIQRFRRIYKEHDEMINTQKKFSRKFHVRSQDKEKLQILLMGKPLDDLVGFPEMEVEIMPVVACLKYRATRFH